MGCVCCVYVVGCICNTMYCVFIGLSSQRRRMFSHMLSEGMLGWIVEVNSVKVVVFDIFNSLRKTALARL